MNTRLAPYAVGLIVAGSLSVAGCSSGALPSASPETQSVPAQCGATADAVGGSDTPVVAVLGATGDNFADYRAEADSVVDCVRLWEVAPQVLVSGVGAGAPVAAANVVLVGEGANDLLREANLKARLLEVDEGLAALADAPASDDRDIFAALTTLDQSVDPTAATVDVVIFADPVSGASPALTPEALAEPTAVLNELAAAGRIPDCKGWSLHFVGPGTQDQPALLEFWRQFAARCGGALVTWEATLTRFPGDRNPVSPADTAQVEITTVEETSTAEFPGDVTFLPNQAGLRPEVESALHDVLAVAEGALSITITGHAASTGEPEREHELSERRAAAVATWLIDHGADASVMQASGVGSSQLKDAENPVSAANRRVTVVIVRPGESRQLNGEH